MTDSAYALARLRASRFVDNTSADDALHDVAEACGRRLVRLTEPSALGLGWDDGRAPVSERGVVTASVRKVGLAVFAIVLRQCWPEPTDPPWPGQATTRAAVLEAMSRLRVEARQGVGALDHNLVFCELVAHAGNTVRLGRAVALWDETTLAAMRRLHGTLPKGESR